MQILILNPEIVLPWEHECVWAHNHSLEQRANEEKQNPRTMDEILGDVNEYILLPPVEKNRRMLDRKTKGWKYVSPVSVFDAPEDMLGIGQYIIYNGHNRRAAAKSAGILLPCLLIDSQDSIRLYATIGNDLPDLVIMPDFESQKFRLWELARNYAMLKGRYR